MMRGEGADRGEGRGWLRVALVSVGLCLAGAATLALAGTHDPQKLRLAVVGALWAFVLAALAVPRRRSPGAGGGGGEPPSRREIELRRTYEIELQREVAARREYELQLEVYLRRELEQGMRQDVEALRGEVDRLRSELLDRLDGELRMERIETTRLIGGSLRALQDEARRLGLSRTVIAEDHTPRPELSAAAEPHAAAATSLYESLQPPASVRADPAAPSRSAAYAGYQPGSSAPATYESPAPPWSGAYAGYEQRSPAPLGHEAVRAPWLGDPDRWAHTRDEPAAPVGAGASVGSEPLAPAPAAYESPAPPRSDEPDRWASVRDAPRSPAPTACQPATVGFDRWASVRDAPPPGYESFGAARADDQDRWAPTTRRESVAPSRSAAGYDTFTGAGDEPAASGHRAAATGDVARPPGTEAAAAAWSGDRDQWMATRHEPAASQPGGSGGSAGSAGFGSPATPSSASADSWAAPGGETAITEYQPPAPRARRSSSTHRAAEPSDRPAADAPLYRDDDTLSRIFSGSIAPPRPDGAAEPTGRRRRSRSDDERNDVLSRLLGQP